MRGGLYDKETGKDVIWPSQMVYKETDSEQLAYALGELLDILMDRGLISAQDAIDVIPYADRCFTASPPNPNTTEQKGE